MKKITITRKKQVCPVTCESKKLALIKKYLTIKIYTT